MLSEPDPEVRLVQKRDRKFLIAMAMFGVLAVIIWFTFGEGTAFVFGRQIEMRWIPLFVIGTFVFRTIMAREADKIRRGSGK
ncbi:hypothetical protein [Acidicapsa ligni]|uniref:hypothetical protein n=1 Tax=Acidicapsa ligni TaxID=542300 RepID=UPI0021E0C82F|nr:hypothetical protein [Acidicapsa ligni]